MNEKETRGNIHRKRLAVTALLLVICIFSMTIMTKAASDPDHHTKTIQSLDEKKKTVLKLAAASAAAATAIAAIPGDATTPVANKLADMTSYFLLILVVVFAEKYLVTLTGCATFFILLPVACVLFGAGMWSERGPLKILAGKVAVFGLVIFLIIPFSMRVSDIIEATYESSVETAIEEAQKVTDEINEKTDAEGNVLEQAWKKIKGGVAGVVEKGETVLNNFIETIAIMLVTSCVIPVIILLFTIWVVKILFGIQIRTNAAAPAKLPGIFSRRRRLEEGK